MIYLRSQCAVCGHIIQIPKPMFFSTTYKQVTGAKSRSHLRTLSRRMSAFICSHLPAFAHNVPSAFHQPSRHLSGPVHLSPPSQSFPRFPKPELISLCPHSGSVPKHPSGSAWWEGCQGMMVMLSEAPGILTQPGVSLRRHSVGTRCGAQEAKENLLGSQAANPAVH